MPIGPFDAIEVIALVFNLIAFLFMYMAYAIGINTEETRRFWAYFFWIAVFISLTGLFCSRKCK